MSFPIENGDFHSYVSLPEGTLILIPIWGATAPPRCHPIPFLRTKRPGIGDPGETRAVLIPILRSQVYQYITCVYKSPTNPWFMMIYGGC